ncbi:ThiF family adenylyltransferase [Nocardia takedensis]|uniref:ThiF family adenylyltransferase n=1 Tax=Nocardia takedensis TaxID=259390 RepID=UPI0002D898BB|nr:ThiF family adenylyltransferase [Nocardia takedensis]
MIEIHDPAGDEGALLAALLVSGSGRRVVDAWSVALEELRELDPGADLPGVRYAVFESDGAIVKLPDPETFRRLRTARNRHLIDEREQRRWSSALIGVAGLSVGASALTTCALTGATRFRLADRDTLGLTNLNRLVSSVRDIGTPKVELAHRRVLDLDPFSEVETFPLGYTADTAEAFLGVGTEPLTVVLEEMDDAAAKIDLRRRARAAGIPVLMATDNGDNAILDVERYDLDRGYPLFHGRAGDLTDLDLSVLADPRERVRIAGLIVGTDITPRTRYSLTEVGRSLPSWPQLGTAATVAGAVAAFAARLIVCGHPLESGRYRVDLDRALLGPAAGEANRWNEMSETEFLRTMAARNPLGHS